MFREPRDFFRAIRPVDPQHFQIRSEACRLALPVREERGRTNNQGRTVAAMQAEKGERLHRFAEAHLVGQDSAEILLRERREPGHAGELIVAQLPAERTELLDDDRDIAAAQSREAPTSFAPISSAVFVR